MQEWVAGLTDEEREEAEQMIVALRTEMVVGIYDDTVFVALMPDVEGIDVKFANALGIAVLFDKPIVVGAAPGVNIPEKLFAVADEVVRADLETDAGREEILAAARRVRP